MSTWLVLSLSAWMSLVAAVGWVAALLAEPIGSSFDAMHRPGSQVAWLADVALAAVLVLSLILPIAAALVPAAAWYRRLPRRVLRAVTGLWVAWVGLGLAGWVLAFSADSPGLTFFLIEAVVPFAVGFCFVSLLSALVALWSTRRAASLARRA